MTVLQNVEQSYTSEVIRKGIHLFSLLIPVVYYYIPQSTALMILVPLTLLFLGSDIARITIPAAGALYERFFGFLLRRHERSTRIRRLNGASYVLISATVGVIVFPKLIFLTAFAILIISDSAAALVGRRYGRHPFRKKSLEGSLGFLVTALLVSAVAPKAVYAPGEYLIAAAGSVIGMVVESGSAETIDDNLSIPLAIGVAMWIMYALLLPGVDVYALEHLR